MARIDTLYILVGLIFITETISFSYEIRTSCPREVLFNGIGRSFRHMGIFEV